jgi:hypothetical protein
VIWDGSAGKGGVRGTPIPFTLTGASGLTHLHLGLEDVWAHLFLGCIFLFGGFETLKTTISAVGHATPPGAR